MVSAQFASVMYMFRHKGRVRLVLNEQDTTPGGGLDRLIDNVFTAGAEDFNQVLGDNRGVEIEVRSVSLFWIRSHLMIYICLDGLR